MLYAAYDLTLAYHIPPFFKFFLRSIIYSPSSPEYQVHQILSHTILTLTAQSILYYRFVLPHNVWLLQVIQLLTIPYYVALTKHCRYPSIHICYHHRGRYDRDPYGVGYTRAQDPDWYGRFGFSSGRHQRRRSTGMDFMAAGPSWSDDVRSPRIYRRWHATGMDYVMSGALHGTDYAGIHRHSNRPSWRRFGW